MKMKSKTVHVAVLDKTKCKGSDGCGNTTENEVATEILGWYNGIGGGLHHKMIEAKITVTVEFLEGKEDK